MAYEFKLPDLGEGVAEGEIARWLVDVGQELEEDASGTVARILVQAGELVPVGTPLVVIGDGEVESVAEEAGEQVRAEEPGPAAADEAAPAQPSERVKATPLVRRGAAELGVDHSRLAGPGPGGRVPEEPGRRVAAMSGGQTPGHGQERRVPLRGVRRLIAQHLTTAHREVPAVTVVEECDFTALSESRGERSYLPYLLEAVVAGLKEFPELNATLDGEEIVFWERYDLGVAVQTDEGLLVPVLRAADERSLDELEEEARRLAEGARAGTLAPEELRGSTFTVTSAGKLGGLFATPLVNHPEVAILGLHRVGPRPAVVDGELAVRQIGWLACTFDHRVVDGARASAFLLSVIERLERPEE